MEDMRTTSTVGNVVEASGESVRTVQPCNVYRDVFGAWRWEYEDTHGDMHDSLDSFDTYQDCVVAAQRLGLMPQD